MTIPSNYGTLSELRNSPWRIKNELRRRLLAPVAYLHFRLNGIAWGDGWRILGLPIIQKHRLSTITIGRNLELRSWYGSNPLAPYHPVVLATRNAGARIEIGADCGFTGTTIVAAEHIRIGDRVLFGANTVVTDTDFHPIDPEARRIDILAANHAPVTIGSDVFIGMNTIILKGVHIGDGSTIGAGSVVVKSIPPGSLAAGNPARVIRPL